MDVPFHSLIYDISFSLSETGHPDYSITEGACTLCRKLRLSESIASLLAMPNVRSLCNVSSLEIRSVLKISVSYSKLVLPISTKNLLNHVEQVDR